MIISRTPFRISFVGGGTDLPDFYRHHPGCVISTSIDRYMYINIHPFFYKDRIQLKYSKTEQVGQPEEIFHPIFRTLLTQFGLNGVEIDSIADVPAASGLGSSSSFTVGLLHALHAYSGRYASRETLAAEACNVEMHDLGEPIGKQDQYAAAFGGLNMVRFKSDDSVVVEPIILPHEKRDALEQNLMLFFTGITRNASDILHEQKGNTVPGSDAFDCLVQLTDMAKALHKDLATGELDSLGAYLHDAWLLKQRLSCKITSSEISRYYDLARNNGAVGGKLLGAGGGGFLLLYVYPDAQERVRTVLAELQEMKVRFDMTGTRIIYVGEET